MLGQLGGRSLPVDVTDAKAVERAVRAAAPEAVVHLAAVSAVGASWDDAGEVWRLNAVGTVNVLEAVRVGAPDVRVLVASTGEVYGRAQEIPTTEQAPLKPVSPYAASKVAAEVASAYASPQRAESSSGGPSRTKGPVATSASRSAPGRRGSPARRAAGRGTVRVAGRPICPWYAATLRGCGP